MQNVFFFRWLTTTDTAPNWDIQSVVHDAVCSGAQEYLHHVNELNDSESGSSEDKLQNIIKITQLIRSDLQRGIEYYDKIFQEKLHFPFTETCYKYYEEKLVENFQPTIEGICKNLKRITLPEDRFERLPEHEEVNMGTTLFEVYLVLKRFAVLGSGLSPEGVEYQIAQFHQWFIGGVAHWLDISVYKALIRFVSNR